MKQLFFLLLLLLAFFASCGGDRRAEALLASADSLADVDADSARRLLGSLRDEMESSSRSVRNHYALLCIKADDKANIRQTSDSAILRLVDYYEHGGDERLLPVAYYYAGRFYRLKHDAMQALDYYQKAIDLGERLTPNVKFLSQVYSQIGYILNYQNLYVEALKNRKRAYEISELNADTIGMIYTLRDLGDSYWNLGKLDSACFYYDKAIRMAKEDENIIMYANINSQIVTLYLQMGNKIAAEKALRNSEIYVDSNDISSILSIRSEYYSVVGKYDSAYICNMALLKKGNVYGKKNAYGELTEYYLSRKIHEKALEYFRGYRFFDDSVAEITASDEIAKAYTMYNYKMRERENYELKLKQKNARLRFTILSSVCIVLVLTVVFLLVRKNLHTQLIKLKKERLKHISPDSSGIVRQKENETKLIEDTVIYKCIQKKLNDGYASGASLTDSEWFKLDEAVNKISPNFSKKVHDLCKMSEHEYRVCLLIKVGITPTNIALLTHHSKEAITSVRRRLYYKAFGEKASPSEWDKVIRSL